jgi:hypothetical protein
MIEKLPVELMDLVLQIKNKFKNMKLDLEKLQELSMKFSNRALPGGLTIDNSLTQYAIQTMLKVTLEYNESSYSHAPTNVKLAFETLRDLGVIVFVEPDVKPQHLNS